MAVLNDLSQMTKDQLIAALLASQKAKETKVSFKVGEKGGLVMGGFGRYPVTLYKSQWRKLLANVPAIEEALAKYDAQLASKDD